MLMSQMGVPGILVFYLIITCSSGNHNVGCPQSVLLYMNISAHSHPLSLSCDFKINPHSKVDFDQHTVYTVYFVLAPIPRTFSFCCRIGTGGACSRKFANPDKLRATGFVTLSLVVPPSCAAISSKSTRRPGRRRG